MNVKMCERTKKQDIVFSVM